MSEELETAQRYRERAQELRIAAADKQHAFIRDNLLSIAETYDQVARTLENIDKSNKNAPTTDSARPISGKRNLIGR